MTNWVFACLLGFSISTASAAAPADGTSEVSFRWLQKKTSLELRMFVAPGSMASRVGEQGEQKPGMDLPVLRPLDDDKLKMLPGDSQIVYLVAKNTGKKPVSFFVAPHLTKPESASLGFKFQCLCYNHVYRVGAGKVWYRVMKLSLAREAKGPIELTHELFPKN